MSILRNVVLNCTAPSDEMKMYSIRKNSRREEDETRDEEKEFLNVDRLKLFLIIYYWLLSL